MAATFSFIQDTGEATGSPAKGTTRTEGIGSFNFKSVDSPSAPYTANPILRGENSYTVYIAGKFTGSFNQILNVKWAHTAGVLGDGLTLNGKVTSTYQTPSATLDGSLDDHTEVTNIDDGVEVLLSTVGPEGADPTESETEACWTQYLVGQLVTDEEAEPGDIQQATWTLSYSEN